MSPLLRKLRKIFLSFKNILSKWKPADLEKWINTTLALKFRHLNSIIKGLKQDLDTVINAIKQIGVAERLKERLTNKKQLNVRCMEGQASNF